MLNYLRKKIFEIAKHHNSVDAGTRLGKGTYLSGSTLRGSVITGDACRIVQAHVEGTVTLGRFTSLWGPGIHVIGRVEGIVIGSFCSIARYVSIQEDYHDMRRTTTYWIERNVFGEPDCTDGLVSRGRIAIGNDVWIGAGAQILSGVTVGSGAVIGAGSVVTRNVAPFTVVAGNPARVVRMRFSAEQVRVVEASQWWDWPLEKIRDNRSFLTQIRD